METQLITMWGVGQWENTLLHFSQRLRMMKWRVKYSPDYVHRVFALDFLLAQNLPMNEMQIL